MRDELDALGRWLIEMSPSSMLGVQTRSRHSSKPGAREGADVRSGLGSGPRRTGEAQTEILCRVVGEAEQVAAEHVRIVDDRRDGREVGLQGCRDGQRSHLLRTEFSHRTGTKT